MRDYFFDIIVVWEQWDRSGGGTGRIYAAVCHRKSNGNYKVGKARCISTNKDFNSEPGIAFNPNDLSYLVVWEKRDNVGGASTSANIVGRKLNLKGRPVGPVFNITDSYDSDDENVVITCLNPLTNTGFDHVVAWFHLPNFGQERYTESGIYAARLDEDGKIKEGPRKVYAAKFSGNTVGSMSPGNILNSYGNSYYLTVSYAVPGADDEAVLLQLGAHVGLTSSVVLEKKDGVYPRVAELWKTRLQVGWYRYGTGDCYNQFYKKNLKRIKKSFKPFSESTSKMDLISVRGGGSYEVASTGSRLHLTAYNKKGKKTAGPGAIDIDSYVSLDFVAEYITGFGDIIVLFGDDTNADNVTSELKAVVFSVN